MWCCLDFPKKGPTTTTLSRALSECPNIACCKTFAQLDSVLLPTVATKSPNTASSCSRHSCCIRFTPDQQQLRWTGRTSAYSLFCCRKSSKRTSEGWIQTLRQAYYPKGSAMCVQGFDDSRKSAIHITYRISLRPSSLRLPRHPWFAIVLGF